MFKHYKAIVLVVFILSLPIGKSAALEDRSKNLQTNYGDSNSEFSSKSENNIVGKNYFIKGNTFWFKPIPFKIQFPKNWKIFAYESYNPKVVFSHPENKAQAELYWLVMYDAVNLGDFIKVFLDKFWIDPFLVVDLVHADGDLIQVLARENNLYRELFFLKKGKRIYILSCTCPQKYWESASIEFYYLIDNFRLFNGYKIK
ncbi:MAG: hypothetical protein ABII27_08690 [bacterium]